MNHTKKGHLVCARIKLFRAKCGMYANHALSGKYGMYANHALSGEILYRKSRMTRSENYYPTLYRTNVHKLCSASSAKQLNNWSDHLLDGTDARQTLGTVTWPNYKEYVKKIVFDIYGHLWLFLLFVICYGQR